MKRRALFPACLLGLIVCFLTGYGSFAGPASAPAGDLPAVRVFAAASLTDVLENLRPAAREALGVDFEVNPASSGTLAKQIEKGAPADLMISADIQWIDYLDKRKLIDASTRRTLLSNRLVVVVSAGDDPSGRPARPGTLGDLADKKFLPLAIGDPTYVPAGKYAQQSLQAAGVWEKIKDQTALAPDVRAALAFVKSGQCPAGMVYATDARGVKGVEIVFEVPDKLHEPILYAAAVVDKAANAPAARKLLEWLASDQAQAAFKKAGFAPPPAQDEKTEPSKK